MSEDADCEKALVFAMRVSARCEIQISDMKHCHNLARAYIEVWKALEARRAREGGTIVLDGQPLIP